ncbi:MAG TPA: hypothetical protein PLU88_04790 [Armatimonadota bacterium]|nr:hypothetical protein [Armatimonadota bacterium]HOM70875.1 hypothetical protein [Armatimonadota bacterium]HOP79277.1 hypothetical protein [Armatimonadota bacterium]HPP74425.1 hypothetical protein [Armatimonadota bacterium]
MNDVSNIQKMEWQMNDINYVDVIDFDPSTDFTGDIVKTGVSEIFKDVKGYFDRSCKRGVIIGTKQGEFFLLGFARPNYAATVILRFIYCDL